MKFFYNASNSRQRTEDIRQYIKQCSTDLAKQKEALKLLGESYFKTQEVRNAESALRSCITATKQAADEAEKELRSIK